MLWPPTSGKCHVVKPAWSAWLSFFASAASFYPPLVWPISRATRSEFASCRILIDPPSRDISHVGMFLGVVPRRPSLRFPYSCWTCCNTWLDENLKINRILFSTVSFPSDLNTSLNVSCISPLPLYNRRRRRQSGCRNLVRSGIRLKL